MTTNTAQHTPLPWELTLEALDAQILSDITEAEGSTEESPKVRPIFYAGWPQELAAGLCGGRLSPYFDTVEQVQCWLTEYLVRAVNSHEALVAALRDIAGAIEVEPIYGALHLAQRARAALTLAEEAS